MFSCNLSAMSNEELHMKKISKHTMKSIKLLIISMLAITACACSPQRRIIYFQDVNENPAVKLADDNRIRIKPLDRLTVVVSSKDPELAAPFNATTSYNSLSSNPLGSTSINGINSLQIRTVDENGNLYMPIIGEIHCAGKTRSELAEEISKKIIEGGYISDASVNIQFADMKIFVLGEVTRPGQFDVTRDQITLLEALSMAGDMTIYGNRSNVAVIRKENGETKIYTLNLLKTDAISSPAFFLQQGDVVYVQPNRYRSAVAEINQNRSFWISLASTFVSVATLAMTIISYTNKK